MSLEPQIHTEGQRYFEIHYSEFDIHHSLFMSSLDRNVWRVIKSAFRNLRSAIGSPGEKLCITSPELLMPERLVLRSPEGEEGSRNEVGT